MLFAQAERGPLIEFTLAPLLEDHGFSLALMGILVVFMALSLVVAFIAILPRLAHRISVTAPQRATASIIADADELPEETLAVIAAAVSETVRVPHRIVRIRGLTSEDLGWSLEGRMVHHQSHRLPRRDHR